MILIPGWLISMITFPGVIAHEFGHRLFCDITKVPVYKVRYFQVGNPAGYVIHGPVQGLRSAFLIVVGPLIVNTVLCALLTLPIVIPVMMLKVYTGVSQAILFLAWVGYSIGMHAFPSNEDMDNFTSEVKRAEGRGVLYVGVYLLAVVIKLANVLRIFWFDAIYAAGISLLLPWLIVRL